MSKVTEILKLQEDEFDKIFPYGLWDKEGAAEPCIDGRVKSFIQSYNAKIIKAVTEEMTGQLLNPYKEEIQGYNDRVQVEIKIAKQLINENLCTEKNQNL